MGSTPITLPLDAVDDAEVEVTDWLVADGAHVVAEQTVAEVSTAKVSVEVLAPVAGVVRCEIQIGDVVKLGESIGRIDHD